VRVWLYDRIVGSTELQVLFGYTTEEWPVQVMPRESRTTIPKKPFIIYGMGNETNEQLSEDADHKALRQFFQVWLHDEGGDYGRIDEGLEILRLLLQNGSDPDSDLTTINHLENSQEFSNESYNSIFRYARFQAIISKGVTV
jgi:hypothetical protein